MTAVRPKRHLAVKDCDRCLVSKPASEFPKVRGGGTADVCNTCKSEAVSEAMRDKHTRAAEAMRRSQEEHFARTIARQKKNRGDKS
jgi:hypothetical protein